MNTIVFFYYVSEIHSYSYTDIYFFTDHILFFLVFMRFASTHPYNVQIMLQIHRYVWIILLKIKLSYWRFHEKVYEICIIIYIFILVKPNMVYGYHVEFNIITQYNHRNIDLV